MVDFPGVKGQESTQNELLDSLKIDAEDMLSMEDLPGEIPSTLYGSQTTQEVMPWIFIQQC